MTSLCLCIFIVNNFYCVINCLTINRVKIHRAKCLDMVTFYRQVISVITLSKKKTKKPTELPIPKMKLRMEQETSQTSINFTWSILTHLDPNVSNKETQGDSRSNLTNFIDIWNISNIARHKKSFKGYLRYNSITSQNESSEAQV